MSAGIIIKGEKVLLVHNRKHGLRIEPPGGKKRADERWEESVIREIREELGVTVRTTAHFGDFDTHSPEGEFTVRMYLCEIIEGEPKALEPDKVPEFGWYTLEEIERLKKDGSLVPNMVEAIEKLRKHMGEWKG